MSNFTYDDWCATKIQASFRGHATRKRLTEQNVAAESIQQKWHETKKVEGGVLTVDDAVMRIQRVWRRFSSIKIYRYYRDMIHFRERGDPQQLLRAINPKEAMYLDAASGTHLRFRLGGSTFPPIIYYKIFTHRPVTDMCSFSPKDYTAEVTLAPKNLHSKEIPGVREFLNDRSNWYQRVDNNGWRPLSEHILVDIDPITQISASKRRPFHYNPIIRKEEAILRRKLRQREWMEKLYREKKGEEIDEEGFDRVEMLQNLEGDEDLDEDDMELLRWTSTLDFQMYQRDWMSLATSEWSEASVPVPSDFFDNMDEIPEIPIDGYAPDYENYMTGQNTLGSNLTLNATGAGNFDMNKGMHQNEM